MPIIFKIEKPTTTTCNLTFRLSETLISKRRHVTPIPYVYPAMHAKVNGVSSKEYFSFGFAGRLVVFAVKLNSTTRELTLKIFNDGSSWIHLDVTGQALSCVNVPAGMIKVLASKSEIWIPPHGEKTVRLYIYTEQDASCTIGVSLTPLS